MLYLTECDFLVFPGPHCMFLHVVNRHPSGFEDAALALYLHFLTYEHQSNIS